jgi:hypothetical protein
VGVVVGAVVLAIIVFMAAGGSGGNKTALTPPGASTTTSTTHGGSTTTSTAGSTPASPTAVAPIHVDLVVGMVVIAGHMSCVHEDKLTGDSLADVEAAVAADNNSIDSGGAAKPYAHDAAAQGEIVRASVQQLHATHRFYTDCRPVSSTGETASEAESGTGTPTASGTGTATGTSTPPSSTPSLPPSR